MTRHEPGLSSSPRRVLVVDDDRDFRLEAAAVLRGAGYEVSEATCDEARSLQGVMTTRDMCVVALQSQPKPITAFDLLETVARQFS